MKDQDKITTAEMPREQGATPIDFLVLSIATKHFTVPLPSGKDVIRAVNAHDALVAALRNVIATHCPNEKQFCGACTDARKLLTETETGQ